MWQGWLLSKAGLEKAIPLPAALSQHTDEDAEARQRPQKE